MSDRRTFKSLLGLSRVLKRNALVMDQLITIVFSLLYIGTYLSWITYFLPTFGIYHEQGFSYSWLLLTLTVLRAVVPIANVYAYKHIVSSDIRKFVALLITIVFVLIDVILLVNAGIFLWLICPSSSGVPLCTPTASLEALIYYSVAFLVGDFVFASIIHKLRNDVNVYKYGPMQMRYKTY